MTAVDGSTPPRGTFVYAAAGLMLLTAVYACCVGAPMAWDGAHQFNVTLIGGKPFVYETRFHTLFLWQPFVLVSHFTTNLQVLWTVYGMPFLGAPVVAILVSWWLVRRHEPRLMIWVLFGVAISPLPGQIFVINDSIFQQHLFWPLFLSIFVPLDAKKWVVLAILALFEFAHPIGLLLFCMIGAAALVLMPFDRARLPQLALRAGLGFLLGIAALWKVRHWVDPYAVSEANWDAAYRCWYGGVRGLPLRGLSWMLASGVLFFIGRLLYARPGLQTRFALLAVVPAVVGTAIFVYWAQDEHRWAWALEYRRWVVPLSASYYLLCWLDYVIRCRDSTGSTRGLGTNAANVNGSGLLALALIFSVVFGIQCRRFGVMVNRLHRALDASPGVLVPYSTMDWAVNTPLDHWGTTDLAISIQGKSPRKLLLGEDWKKMMYGQSYHPGSIHFGPDKLPPLYPNHTFYRIPPVAGPDGWYDMRPILQR